MFTRKRLNKCAHLTRFGQKIGTDPAFLSASSQFIIATVYKIFINRFGKHSGLVGRVASLNVSSWLAGPRVHLLRLGQNSVTILGTF